MAKVDATATLEPDNLPPAVVESPIETQRSTNDELNACTTCSKPVTKKVEEYCLSQLKRFNNRIYCYEHQ